MKQSKTERRSQTSEMVQELLRGRQQVWSQYCAIGEMKPFGLDQPLENKVQEFCQTLIDYISLGHFGIYQRIVDGSERRRKVLDLAEEIYPRIAEATVSAVDFNDKYEGMGGEGLRAELAEDLSKLGEALAARNDLEDRLIESILV